MQLAVGQPQTIKIIAHLVVGTDTECFGSVLSILDSVHHVNHAFVEPQCKHLRVDTIVENGEPLRGQRVTSHRRSVLTGRVRIGIRGVASVLNSISSPGELEVPLRDREWWKITTARHVQSGRGHR